MTDFDFQDLGFSGADRPGDPGQERRGQGARLLVVDDEPRILDFLRRALTAHGFVVETASDGREALRALGQTDYDLVLLDLMMPGIDGVAVIREARANGGCPPVLVLSARSDLRVKVRCLDLGAADYLSKPFALAELVARIRVRVRESSEAHLVHRVGISLDVAQRTADVGEGPVRLSEREFALLQRLMRNPGGICSREELLNDVWGYAFDPGTNVVDVCVRRLRAKLGNELVETARNAGYRLRLAQLSP